MLDFSIGKIVNHSSNRNVAADVVVGHARLIHFFGNICRVYRFNSLEPRKELWNAVPHKLTKRGF